MVKTKTYSISQNGQVVMSITITQPKGVKYTNIQWDSKTGVVTANVNNSNKRIPIPFIGEASGRISPGPFQTDGIYNINYHYWYY